MKVLVTGGSGFIGRNLIEGLASKYDIYAPSRSELDLTDENQVTSYLRKNSRIFFNFYKNRECFGKMLVTGSGAIYDMRNYQPKMKESFAGKNIPADEHGLFRYMTGNFISDCHNIIDLRLFGVFGKYEDYAIRFISNAICKALFDLPITIRQNRRFDYLYINDLIPVVEFFINHDLLQSEYNITPDTSIELLKLAEKVKHISGKNLPILVAQEGIGLEYSGDNTRLRNEMPDLKFTDIDVAIEELYEWNNAHRDQINHNVLLIDK
jgi:UDP-glucose 4-epimerase